MKRAWTLDQIEVFCTAARLASFSAAARELGVSPAYVTKQIAQLERALGATLFHRTTRQVRISSEGEVAYGWARKLLEAADSLHGEVSGSRGALTGTLRIASSTRLGGQHVAPILSAFARRHPGLEIWLELVDRRVDLIAEEFDIDVRVGDVDEPHLVAHRLAPGERLLCASRAYLKRRGRPRTLAELTQHDCLLYRDRDQPFGSLRMEGPRGVETVKLASRMGSNQAEVVRRWALDGHGIVLQSEWYVAADLRERTLERVLPQYRQAGDVYAVTASRASGSARLRSCVEFLRQQLAAGPHALYEKA